MAKTYLITFTPVDTFFFGGSVSFADEYYVQSAKFPIPSTVLGALRASLLIHKGYLLQQKNGRYIPKEYREPAVALTGSSFLNTFDASEPDFGIIEKISPCFLVKKDLTNAYFPVPNDIVKLKSDGQFHQTYFDFVKGLASNCSKRLDTIPLWKLKNNDNPLKSKDMDIYGTFFGGTDFWHHYNEKSVYNDIIDLDTIFHPHPQVGIALENRQAKDGAFYVKTDFTLDGHYAFAVIAHFKNDPAFTKRVVMGGEQSVFEIDCIPCHTDQNHAVESHPIVQSLIAKDSWHEMYSEKQVAISPLIAEKDLFKSDTFSHILSHKMGTVRMLNSITDKKGQMHHGPNLKTDAWKIIPAGAVFYLTQPGHLPLISGVPDLIGYNSVLG